jgi:hypothetical protein
MRETTRLVFELVNGGFRSPFIRTGLQRRPRGPRADCSRRRSPVMTFRPRYPSRVFIGRDTSCAVPDSFERILARAARSKRIPHADASATASRHLGPRQARHEIRHVATPVRQVRPVARQPPVGAARGASFHTSPSTRIISRASSPRGRCFEILIEDSSWTFSWGGREAGSGLPAHSVQMRPWIGGLLVRPGAPDRRRSWIFRPGARPLSGYPYRSLR